MWWPACSASAASSVPEPPARPCAIASASTARRNAWGVCASHTRSRSIVSAITGGRAPGAASFTVSRDGTAAIAAVAFDFDGTLADTAADLARALNRLRAAKGLADLPLEELRPHASGGARGVGEATAKAVVSSIVAIFAADYVTTTLMTEL